MQAALLNILNKARANRQAAALIRDLTTGDARVVLRGEQTSDDALNGELESRFRSGKSGRVSLEGREFFINMEVPSPRIIVVGAVHITQALTPMIQQCGFDLTIIDPRTAFATPERFPNVTLLAEWPEEVHIEGMMDPFTAVVAVTHDPKIDDYPLSAALKAGCFYVGALGSRKTHGKRLERLGKSGLSETQLARIDAPIGLDIGAASPAEIAVAILGQILATLRKPL